MKLNSKVTGGLAWAGLVLVLAVPSADMLTKPSAKTATITSGMDAMETASVKPAVKPVIPAVRKSTSVESGAQASDDPVEAFVSSGKKLPSYISDAPAEVATATPRATPVAVTPVVAPTTLASTPAVGADGTFTEKFEADVAAAPPQPYPASLRPVTSTAALPTATEAPLIIDETEFMRRQAAIEPIRPPLPIEAEPVISGEELEEWDSGSLADYLERKGLINESREARESELDEDGFFLSDSPKRSGVRVIRRLDDREDDFSLF